MCGQRIQEAACLYLDDKASVGSVDPEPEVKSGHVVNTFTSAALVLCSGLHIL